MALPQLIGMARYEFIMHWRRRSLLVITLAIIAVTVVATFIVGGSGAERLLAPVLANVNAQPDRLTTFIVVFMGWAPVAVVMAFLLPIVLADTIPLDRDAGVRELMDSLPLRPLIYLTGKLIGAWAATLAAVIVTMVVTGLVWRLQAGTYDMRAFAEMWLLGAASLVFLNGGIAVLVSSTQPSRRRAVMLIVVFFVIMFITAGRIFDLSSENQSLWTYANPLRAPIIIHYAGDTLTAISDGFFAPKVTMTLIAGMVELAGVMIALLLWTRWREQRA